LPVLVGDAQEPTGARGGGADVVHHDVDPVPGQGNQPGWPVGGGQVQFGHLHPARPRQLVQLGGRLPGTRDDVHVVRGQPAHHRQPDSPAGARDDGHASRQTQIHHHAPIVAQPWPALGRAVPGTPA
jgi:hypothetical protein